MFCDDNLLPATISMVMFEHDLLISYFISESNFTLFLTIPVAATWTEQSFSKLMNKKLFKTYKVSRNLIWFGCRENTMIENLDYNNITNLH